MSLPSWSCLRTLYVSNRRRLLLALTLSASVLVLLPVTASGQIYIASITGSVRDISGAVIPDTTLVLTNVNTGVEKRLTSNAAGNYLFSNLQPGTYTLEASKVGFSTNKLQPFTLVVDQRATLDFSLSVSAVKQSVTVEAVGTTIQTATADLGRLVSQKETVSLPLNGRNFTQLLTLTPGASPVNVAQSGASYGVFAPVASQSQVAFPSMNGQPNRSNFFYLDGINDAGAFASTYAVPPLSTLFRNSKFSLTMTAWNSAGLSGASSMLSLSQAPTISTAAPGSSCEMTPSTRGILSSPA
jgi:hypothetical protein